MKRWHVCIAARTDYCGIQRLRPIITDGRSEVEYGWGLTLARFKAWRMNRAAGSLPDIEQVRADRKRYDDAMREVLGND